MGYTRFIVCIQVTTQYVQQGTTELLAVQHAIIRHHVGDRMLAPKALACTILPEDNYSGLDAVCTEGGAETPVEQEPCHLGYDLNAHTHISQHAC